MTPDKAAQLGNDLCRLAESVSEIGEKLRAQYYFDRQDREEDHAEPEQTKKSVPEPEKEKTAPEKSKVPTYLDVRSALAEKSRLGFQEEIRKLITSRGLEKLSDIDPSEYSALLKEAEALK